MSNIINRTANTLNASARIPYGAYKALVQLAKDHNGEIDKNPKGFLRVTFEDIETAKNVANRFRADYAEAHAAYVPKSEREPVTNKAPKTTKKSKPSSSKKGDGIIETSGRKWVKANPSCTRAEAAAHGFPGITKLELKALKRELGVR